MTESMFSIVKDVLVPAVKEEFKKSAEEYVDYMLYSKPFDFSKVSAGTGGGRIRVIGPIVTIY